MWWCMHLRTKLAYRGDIPDAPSPDPKFIVKSNDDDNVANVGWLLAGNKNTNKGSVGNPSAWYRVNY